MDDNASEGDANFKGRPEKDVSGLLLTVMGCVWSTSEWVLESKKSRDIRSAAAASSVEPELSGRGEVGENVVVPGVRLDSLVQKESLEASVLAIGEFMSESSELGVDVPESGELGDLRMLLWSSALAVKFVCSCEGASDLTWSLDANFTCTVGLAAPSSRAPSSSSSEKDCKYCESLPYPAILLSTVSLPFIKLCF